AWRAQASGIWHRPIGDQTDRGHPPYDFGTIKSQLLQILGEDWLWQHHFERFGILPLTVCYEDYVVDRPGHLQRIADHLGVEGPPSPLADRIQVMRDEWSTEIVERFTADLH